MAHVLAKAMQPTVLYNMYVVFLVIQEIKYRNYSFFVMETFSDGTCGPKICYFNINPVQNFCLLKAVG